MFRDLAKRIGCFCGWKGDYMSYKKLVSLGLIVGVVVSMGSTSIASADEVSCGKVDSIVSCSSGDELIISVDGSDSLKWSSENPKVVGNSNGVIKVIGEGSTVLKEKESGYSVRVTSSGTKESPRNIVLDYNSSEDVHDVPIRESIETVKVIELNQEIVKSEVKDSQAGFEKKKGINDNSDLAVASESGTFFLESSDGTGEVIKVISPELKNKVLAGSSGSTAEIKLTSDIAIVSCESSNTNVAEVDNLGKVTFRGGGTCIIKVNTPNNSLECQVTSNVPKVDTSKVVLRNGQLGKIDITDNVNNLPVKYSIVSGNADVSPTGEVSLAAGSTVVIGVDIGGIAYYEKEFKAGTINEELWEGMQPAIEYCLGTPYLFGGNTPKSGIDCSAYVCYVYRSVGLYGEGRTTAQALYDMSVKTDNPQPGDMIFFKGTYDTGGQLISHIGIYAGGNMMYHSGDPNQKASFDTPYWKDHFVGFGTMVK